MNFSLFHRLFLCIIFMLWQVQEDNPTEGIPWDNIVWNSSVWIGAVTNFIDFKFLPPEIFSTDGMSDITVSILTFFVHFYFVGSFAQFLASEMR